MNSFESLKELLLRNRSIRRFDESRKIDGESLKDIVSLTTLCASGRNAQPLKYRIANYDKECAAIFPLLAWAGYYTDWDGPEEGQRPTAYIIQCLDTSITSNPLCDEGLQLEALTLGATSLGLSGCIIKSFKPTISDVLNLPNHIKPVYVIALGYAAEKAHIVPLKEDGDYKYYRDENDTQCVPKRSILEILI